MPEAIETIGAVVLLLAFDDLLQQFAAVLDPAAGHVLLQILEEVVMRAWFGRKRYRRPVDLLGHTGYATDEGALIPWPVMERCLELIEEMREGIGILAEEIKRLDNKIPDGEERVETFRRMQEAAACPFERVTFVHEAAARAEARARGESVRVRRRR